MDKVFAPNKCQKWALIVWAYTLATVCLAIGLGFDPRGTQYEIPGTSYRFLPYLRDFYGLVPLYCCALLGIARARVRLYALLLVWLCLLSSFMLGVYREIGGTAEVVLYFFLIVSFALSFIAFGPLNLFFVYRTPVNKSTQTPPSLHAKLLSLHEKVSSLFVKAIAWEILVFSVFIAAMFLYIIISSQPLPPGSVSEDVGMALEMSFMISGIVILLHGIIILSQKETSIIFALFGIVIYIAMAFAFGAKYYDMATSPAFVYFFPIYRVLIGAALLLLARMRVVLSEISAELNRHS